MFRGSFSHSNLLFLLLQTAVLSVRSQAALPLPQCACPSRTGRCGAQGSSRYGRHSGEKARVHLLCYPG